MVRGVIAVETISREGTQVRGRVGQSAKRVEDARLLTGNGRFIDDLEPVAGISHAAILRSTQAHARVVSVDASAARGNPGVFAVLTGEDVKKLCHPFPLAVKEPITYYPVAIERVRYVGEPVAVVIAESRYAAEDALELIEVDYDPLPPVLDVESAIEPGATLIHDEVGSNIGNHRHFEFGDPDMAFADADVVIEDCFDFPRYSSTPIETYGVIAHYDHASDLMTIWSNFHGPFILHRVVSGALGMPQNRLRFVVPPDIGGSFGIKSAVYPYMTLMGVASKVVGRPVKWIEDRGEHLLASSSGTGRVSKVKAAFRDDGELVGLDYLFMDDVGGYIRSPEPATMYRCFGNLNGAYRVRDVRVESMSVMTNKVPTGLNRGFGGPQLYCALERVMDVAAEKLGLDPAEIRMRNLVRKDEFPYRTPSGGIYDSGDYGAVMEKAITASKYDELRQRQAKARTEGKYFGIGVAAVVDPSGTNMGYVTLAQTHEERQEAGDKSGCTEAATISMDPSGGIVLRITTTPQGQGHETVATQIVMDELGIPEKHVHVVAEMDTLTQPWTITTGTYSSRFAPLGASAVATAARKLKNKLARIAAHELGVETEDLELEDGVFKVIGDEERSLPLRRAAGVAHWNAGSLPPEIDPGLHETAFYSLPVTTPPDEEDKVDSSATYGFLVDVIAVEIDPDTFEIEMTEYTSIHDAGTILNPMLVEGQIYGAAVHGLGGALFEEFVYNDDGQLVTGSFMDYLCPTAAESPIMTLDHIETPSPYSLLGAKGAGEGNSMSAPAALVNAIADAMKPAGLHISELPINPTKLFDAIHGEDGP
jgi:2-furoyl-CoA dehydrogenase large subunit